MGANCFILCMNLLIPIAMLLCGIFFIKKSPKSINYFFGYRTTMSMKNIDTWQFAHNYCGKVWKKLGIILMVITIAFSAVSIYLGEKYIENISVMLTIIQIVVLLGSILPVENALKKTFDKDGNRK